MLAQLVAGCYCSRNQLTFGAAVWCIAASVCLIHYTGLSSLLSYHGALPPSTVFELPPLTTEYTLDFEKISLIRKRNMERYEYKFSNTDIDKRSGLSLEEFRDVYDGKW